MASFIFKAYRADGGVETGEIVAGSATEALDILGERGLIPFEAREAVGGQTSRNSQYVFSVGRSLSIQQLAEFSRELAVLLNARLPIDQAMRLLASSFSNAQMANLSEQMLRQLMDGEDFPTAMRNALPDGPPLIHSLILAGETHGSLAAAMSSIADYLERRAALTQKLRAELTYPLLLAATALVSIAIIVSFLVPSLMPLFSDNGRNPPWALYAANELAGFVAEHGLVLSAIMGGMGSTVVFLATSRHTASLRELVHMRIPVLGSLKSDHETALMCRTVGTLLHNGVSLISALETTRKALTTIRFQDALSRATEQVKQGVRLDAAMRQTGRFPDVAVRFVTVGEESARLDEMLLHLATTLEWRLERRIERLMTVLGPVLTVVIGILVGGLILSVMQAILSVNEVALR